MVGRDTGMVERALQVVLISTYELGRQPFGLASPAAWLRRAGATVTCLDLAVQALDEPAVARADLIAFYVPMHTATRLAIQAVPRVRALNPRAHLCFYGLYAAVNEAVLRPLGVQTMLGGEFEEGLVELARQLAGGDAPAGAPEPARTSLARQQFMVPARAGLPVLSRYAQLVLPGGEQRLVGYTEASRGCKHLCRHCPIPPVYGGRFRVVQRAVVLDDIAQQVAAGAQHITFGDPDFLNGPGHVVPIVQELHARWPDLTYDVTIKIEHLLQTPHLPTLKETGCAFITTAVEAVDDRILAIFDKRHTRADFITAAARCRDAGLVLSPTFVTFTPWTTLSGYLDLLHLLYELDLVEHVAPIQYAIRLLIPAGSRLLELPEVRALVDEFDPAALCYPWRHPDPRVDALHAAVLDTVRAGQRLGESRGALFNRVWRVAHGALGRERPPVPAPVGAARQRAGVPHLSEPWYC
jgi:radical SAM superfamily enzyme YgiQ (UPF0313 family)